MKVRMDILLGLQQSIHLSMSYPTVTCLMLSTTSPDHLSLMHNHSTDRPFPGLTSEIGLFECFPHEIYMVHSIKIK